jgi:hypothetical protein
VRAPIVRGEGRIRRVLNRVLWLAIDIAEEDEVTEPPPLVDAVAGSIALYALLGVVIALILRWTIGLSSIVIDALITVVAVAAVIIFIGEVVAAAARFGRWLKRKTRF